ncbi:MAG TPA: helix-turn-helix domain-containing protein [Pseudorhodoplanes sp.]|nr:helix-turn-helix domain-containing protein [Pseudorhodoplanes sp.]
MTPTIAVSTDQIRPAERQAFWTEAICRSFAHIETRPIGASTVSGRFEFVYMGDAKLVRFDSSPQCYRRDARLVSKAGSDEFMFDFQRRGRSSMAQAGSESTIEPGFGVLYDARRPFEDRLDGPEQRSEVLIATVPAVALLRLVPQAERLCAQPVPLSGTVARSIARLVRNAVASGEHPTQHEMDVVACLAALLRLATGAAHGLGRDALFAPLDAYLKGSIATLRPAHVIAAEFGISERTLHRIFADRDTTFERHVLQLRVEQFRALLLQPSSSDVTIAGLAMQCGFADAAHATRTFKSLFGKTPREYRQAEED